MAIEMIPWPISKNVAGHESRTRDRPQSIFILIGVGCSNSFFLIFDRNFYKHTL